MLFEKQNNNTVDEYMTKWLVNTKRPSLKRSSYDRVEQSLNYQIFPAIGKIKLKKLTADDIQMMLNDLAERSSYSTTKKAYVNLKSCLDLAVLKGDIKKNPILAVVLPKNNKSDETVVYYSPEQARAIVPKLFQLIIMAVLSIGTVILLFLCLTLVCVLGRLLHLVGLMLILQIELFTYITAFRL